MLVKKNDVVTFQFTTHRFDTGAATDADGTPTATAYKDNGSADIGGCTVTKIATGHYRVDVDTSDADYEAGKFYNVAIAATVNSVTGKGIAGTFYCVTDDPETIAQTGDGMVASSLDTQAKADVNAEVLDVLNTDTFAEPGQEAPGATITLARKIGYLYKAFRNKIEQTSTLTTLYNDDGTTAGQKSTVSDDGTTYTRGEFGTGA